MLIEHAWQHKCTRHSTDSAERVHETLSVNVQHAQKPGFSVACALSKGRYVHSWTLDRAREVHYDVIVSAELVYLEDARVECMPLQTAMPDY